MRARGNPGSFASVCIRYLCGFSPSPYADFRIAPMRFFAYPPMRFFAYKGIQVISTTNKEDKKASRRTPLHPRGGVTTHHTLRGELQLIRGANRRIHEEQGQTERTRSRQDARFARAEWCDTCTIQKRRRRPSRRFSDDMTALGPAARRRARPLRDCTTSAALHR